MLPVKTSPSAKQKRPGQAHSFERGSARSFRAIAPAKHRQGPHIDNATKGPIFIGRNGERLLGPRHWFDDCVKKANIQHYRWHDNRHTFGSRLAMADVDIRTIAELMGHKKIQMTMRYSPSSPRTQAGCSRTLKGLYSLDSYFEMAGRSGTW